MNHTTDVKSKSNDFEMVATTLFGLEDVLAAELLKLGAKDISRLKRAVRFVGDKGFMYKANYCLRTALRVLKPIRSFTVSDDKNLYDRMQTIDWSDFMSEKDLLAVSTSLNTDIFNHTQYISQKTKDAIVDQFRSKTGIRPSVDLENPTLKIHVHVEGNVCTVSLDSSGDALYKRGYRNAVDIAPLNESLAAGMIQLSGWTSDMNFIDPMCGSGTLAIEAAMYACEIPAGYYREQFGFQRWNDYDPSLFQLIVESSVAKINNRKISIYASDQNSAVIEKAKQNILFAKLEDVIELKCVPFENLSAPEGRGVLIINPPYGERLNQLDVNQLYKNIGDTLKKKFPGYIAWIISSNKEAVHKIGLHANRKIMLFNGALECRFLRYAMYDGTKKQKKIETPT